MSKTATKIFREPQEVTARLAELQLDRDSLLAVIDVAMDAAGEKTPFHCANAAGTFAYQYGTHALRDRFVGEVWKVNRDGNIEAIKHATRPIKVAFANVDHACREYPNGPKPLRKRGVGTEQVCSGNSLFGPDELPEYVAEAEDGCAMYFLMVDPNGAAELTRPVVQNGTFSGYVERIYLTHGREEEMDITFDDADATGEYDPVVARKKP